MGKKTFLLGGEEEKEVVSLQNEEMVTEGCEQTAFSE